MERGLLAGLLSCLLLLLRSQLPAGLRVARDVQRRRFRISGNHFTLEQDGETHVVQLRAGEMHYFRVPEVYWEDRLLRLRAMGLNAVSTYVPWNWHEQVEGQFDFSSDRKNLTRYIELADSLGLLVLLRPGPYICSEWDLGGLPAWLLRRALVDKLQYRTADPKYLELVDRYWGDLLPRVKPLLVENGGPIALVQLENEFGYFGDASGKDRPYFQHLENLARQHLGPDVLLITTDAPNNNAKFLGVAPGILAGSNFGPWENAKKHVPRMLETSARHAKNKGGPELVMELWSGWFQSWRQSNFDERHFKEKGSSLLQYVEVLLNRSASFTLYMAHGGTNFGFWNSATALAPRWDQSQKHINFTALAAKDDLYNSSFVTTSYDYAAPISEEGRHGFGRDGVDKYEGLRGLLEKYRGSWEKPLAAEPPPPVLADYRGDGPNGTVRFARRVGLRDPAVLRALCEHSWEQESSTGPTSMEVHGQQHGVAFYRYRPLAARLRERASEEVASAAASLARDQVEGPKLLELKARDRVTVWSNGRLVEQGWINKKYGEHGRLGKLNVPVPLGKDADHLDVLVEHLGRRAFAKPLSDSLDREAYEDWKGMTEAWFDGHKLENGWSYCGMPLADLYAFNGNAPDASEGVNQSSIVGPSFFEGRFSVDREPADTFMRFNAGMWNSGAAFLNGFNLGRYRRGARGPFDLYVPKSALRQGENVVVLLEMDPSDKMTFEEALVTFESKRGPMLPH